MRTASAPGNARDTDMTPCPGQAHNWEERRKGKREEERKKKTGRRRKKEKKKDEEKKTGRRRNEKRLEEGENEETRGGEGRGVGEEKGGVINLVFCAYDCLLLLLFLLFCFSPSSFFFSDS